MKSHDSRKRNVFRHSISWLSLVCITIFLLTACSYEDAKTPVRATPRSSSTQQAQPTRKAQAPVFQTGIVNPRWGSSSYGASDGEWQNSLSTIKTQTAAAWLEIPVLFSQPAEDSANIHADEGTPTVDAFISGVRQAHAQGFKVFFTPLLTVREPGGWSGLITPDPSIQQSWFDNYWNTLKPYVNAARANDVEQMALATEMEWLESHAPGTLWQQLISRVRRTYTGSLTYDMNWFTVKDPLPGWLKDSGLNYIGVSEYKPLLDTPTPVDSKTLNQLWHDKVKTMLDWLSTQVHKRVVLTEIGYRNNSDALYQTWSATSSAPEDPQLQADAYNAALSNIIHDPNIAGSFFWGWDNVGRFTITGQPAVQVLHKWYAAQPAG